MARTKTDTKSRGARLNTRWTTKERTTASPRANRNPRKESHKPKPLPKSATYEPPLQTVSTTKATTKRTTRPDFQIVASSDRLPPCPGPQLHIFKYHNSQIQWMERLDEDRVEHSGMQGYVFRVKIMSRQYALKVFKDFDAESIRYYWEAYLDSEQDPEIMAYYTDPFFSECRAYGRIREALDEGSLTANPAIPCLGYLFLRKEDEDLLLERGLKLRLDDSETESGSGARRRPIRALVKEFGGNSSGVTLKRQRKICMDLQRLNALRIYNRDVRADNYRKGSLVDFGSSITEPHVIFDAFDKDEKNETYLEDVGMFKGMLDAQKIPLRYDPTVPLGTTMILRRRKTKGNTK